MDEMLIKRIEELEKRIKDLEENSMEKQIDFLLTAVKTASSRQLTAKETAKYKIFAKKISEIYTLIKAYSERK